MFVLRTFQWLPKVTPAVIFLPLFMASGIIFTNAVPLYVLKVTPDIFIVALNTGRRWSFWYVADTDIWQLTGIPLCSVGSKDQGNLTPTVTHLKIRGYLLGTYTQNSKNGHFVPPSRPPNSRPPLALSGRLQAPFNCLPSVALVG